MSFDDELSAFRKYAELYPMNTTLLVDTYDTLRSGVPNAIKVFEELRSAGKMPVKYGIRLDSGDLAYLSKKARKMLDNAGFPEAMITASSDLDEYLIDSLKTQGAKIDSWGVGTKLITSRDCPSFGGVYKLAAIQKDGNFIPKIKLSENQWKITNPGNKKIFRIYEKESGKLKADLIALADETFSENERLLLFDPIATWKKTYLEPNTYTIRELLVPIFLSGRCVYTSPSVMDIREYCIQEQDSLWDEVRRLINPHVVYVDLSVKLYRMKTELLDRLTEATK
jgi:nicotinate phosphoribosyltransferase